MGKVLEFQRGRRPEPARVEHDKDGELVLFTGVRYQRYDIDDESRPDDTPKRESGS